MKKHLIKKIYILFCLLSLLSVKSYALTESSEFIDQTTDVIYELEFKDALLVDVIRVLAEQTGTNIIASKEANNKNVTIYLKNVNIKEAIEAICRINGLWYRQDGENGAYRILTIQEYQKDLTFYKNDTVRVFRLLNPNVRIVAQSIEDLFGDRVELSLGLEPAQEQEFVSGGVGGSTSSNSSNRNNNNRNNSSNSSSQNNSSSAGRVSSVDPNLQLQSELSVDQIEALSEAGDTRISAENLSSLTSRLSPIYVTVNNEHNLIIVRTSDVEVMDSIASLIEQMDKPVPQVLLEMKVLDILVDDNFRSIANLSTTIGQSDVPDPNNAGSFFPTNSFLLGNFPLEGGTFVYEFISDRVRAALELLVQNNRINVLSKPMVLASNNRPAELFVGEETVLTTGVNSDVIVNQTNTSTFIQPETQVRQVGNRITITPFINADNSITLALDQETSSVNVNGGSVIVQNGGGGVTEVAIDTVNTATLNGTVVAKHGYTMAVGGLIRNTKSNNTQKVPVLGDIPVLGSLFRREEQGDEHRELVLLITPYVMRKGEEYEDVTRKRIIEPSHYSNWDTIDVLPEVIKPKQKKPDAIEKDLKIYEENQFQPKKNHVELEDNIISDDAIYRRNINEVLNLISAAKKIKKPDGARRVEVDPYVPSSLFSDRRIIAYPKFSWEQNGTFITRVRIKNISKSQVNISSENIKGDWFYTIFDSDSLEPDGETEGYLLSKSEFINSITAKVSNNKNITMKK
jgi:type II secretory pathway component GspD/PulD (secretin)